MTTLPTANDIKIDVLGWAITQLNEDEALASELRFLDGRRRADLAIVSNNRLTAIEVKGPRDNLASLAHQISDYLEMFLDVYVATSESYLKDVKKIVPRSVGIICTSHGRVDVIRPATQRATLLKANAAKWLQKKDFDNLHRALATSRDADISVLRSAAASQLDAASLQQLALSKIKNRVLTRHNAFIAELGRTMTLDDVQMLTIEKKIRR